MKTLDPIKSLLYPIEKVPAHTILPGFEFTKAQEYAIIMKKPGGIKKILHHCSEIYEVVPNADVIKPVLKALGDMKVEVKGTNRFDTRFSMDILFPESAIDIGRKDPVIPRLRINNSYDGRVKYAYLMGMFRMICSNGMVVPLEGFEDKNISIKMRHTPAVGEYVDPDAILDMINGFQDAIKDFIVPYKELRSKPVLDIEERIQEVIENTKFPTRRAEDAVDQVLYEMEELKLNPNKANDWLIYNGLNNQLNHSPDINMDAHKKERLDQQVLTYLLNN